METEDTQIVDKLANRLDYPLSELLVELKYGRPAEFEKFVDTLIEQAKVWEND